MNINVLQIFAMEFPMDVNFFQISEPNYNVIKQKSKVNMYEPMYINISMLSFKCKLKYIHNERKNEKLKCIE